MHTCRPERCNMNLARHSRQKINVELVLEMIWRFSAQTYQRNSRLTEIDGNTLQIGENTAHGQFNHDGDNDLDNAGKKSWDGEREREKKKTPLDRGGERMRKKERRENRCVWSQVPVSSARTGLPTQGTHFIRAAAMAHLKMCGLVECRTSALHWYYSWYGMLQLICLIFLFSNNSQ